ncbi:MAG: aspartate--ammonia ligase [Clostridia bacterium]|nr:aspartate--ammonia ligase [Clostridia bacterium]
MKSLEKGLILPKGYDPKLSLMETEIAIKKIKDFFQVMLADNLSLTRVSAPLFVDPLTGLNDNLNGVERPVDFTLKDLSEKRVEIVQSLAKWKRMALAKYKFGPNTGLYTDMNAIRRDEELDSLHSIYVDQWDWEKVISKEDRQEDYLRSRVEKIYEALKSLEQYICSDYPVLSKNLPEEIFFITSQELEDMYPDLTPKQREDAITREKIAVFVMKIGYELNSGIKHDGRAPDYDDWDLNGDILLWNPILEMAFEISSMGIRVDEKSLRKQLELTGDMDRAKLDYHKMILNGELPYTIGGGIGQSRLCMYFLNKAHIGEVQVSVWSKEMIEVCHQNNIFLL